MNVPIPVETKLTNNPLPLQKIATVRSVEGNRCLLDISGTTCPAFISTHLPGLQPGQRVVALCGEDNTWLITAAWPMATDEPLLHFDSKTGVFHIEAPRLQLAALGSIELCCGDARISLSMDGKVTVLGGEVLSSARGSHRIEGATIDLN
jgi:hypothetical protein